MSRKPQQKTSKKKRKKKAETVQFDTDRLNFIYNDVIADDILTKTEVKIEQKNNKRTKNYKNNPIGRVF